MRPTYLQMIVCVGLLAAFFGCEQRYDSPPIEPAAGVATEVPLAASSEEIRILAWNIESDGSSTDRIIEQLKTEMPAFDILALSEVPPADTTRLSQFFVDGGGVVDVSRGDDRLTIAWSKRYELIEEINLRSEEFAPGYHRAPLAVHLKDTLSGKQFVVMNNHLARGNADLRTHQAEMLVDWARNQTRAVIAVGDYNMDYEFSSGAGNEAFAAMLADGIYKWVRPRELVDTNWYDPEGDGIDNYAGSILDFTFVAGPAMDWEVESEVVVREGDFPDDDKTSDHRPLLTVIAPLANSSGN